jgi:NADH dehydrogenase [ubiquinone] 1 alpha subcomplex assembly factor 1
MFATPIRLASSGQPGFWRRSLDELKRQSKIAVRLEGLHKPNQPFPLVRFEEESALGGCKVMSDADMGGFSKASLTHIPGTGPIEGEQQSQPQPHSQSQPQTPPHALFAGRISTELPPNRPEIQRSGYAAWRTRDRGTSLFGKLLWDIDPYAFLALRIKSDGRKYFVNIQTESIVPTDLHQHLLPSYTPGEWETVTIPFSSFVRTNYGMVVEPQREMMRQKVRSVGIGLIDRVPGPFELCIADVWATNKAPERGVDSGFDLGDEGEMDGGVMGEVEPRRKKGEPEKILI